MPDRFSVGLGRRLLLFRGRFGMRGSLSFHLLWLAPSNFLSLCWPEYFIRVSRIAFPLIFHRYANQRIQFPALAQKVEPIAPYFLRYKISIRVRREEPLRLRPRVQSFRCRLGNFHLFLLLGNVGARFVVGFAYFNNFGQLRILGGVFRIV